MNNNSILIDMNSDERAKMAQNYYYEHDDDTTH